jgi:hypothetical protein
MTMAKSPATCDVCGEKLPEGAYFCGECGSSVPEFGAPVKTSSQRVVPPASTVVDDSLGPEVIAPEVIATDPPVAELGESESVAPEPTRTVRPYMLVFSTGERAQVVGRGLIGRMPVASAGDTWDHLIVVNDPSKTVSKTHLQIEALPEGLLVTDLASANGTVVSMPGIAAERLAPHERVILTPGATVGMGDQSFTIE